MSRDDDQRPSKDAKTTLEDQLVQRAAEPWAKELGKDEQEGLRIFLNLFVKTHPAMQSMVARRVQEDAPVPTITTPASVESATAALTDTQAVRTEETSSDDTAARRLVDASGVVSKPDADATNKGSKGKVGGGR